MTGDELVPPGQTLEDGQVYESNSCVLASALQQLGCSETELFYSRDNRKATDIALKQALKKDLVLISGGISVGDYDFVGHSLVGWVLKLYFTKCVKNRASHFFWS